ncbi:hypothetical protein AABB24_038473, partial [Solanum stoloniferum]
ANIYSSFSFTNPKAPIPLLIFSSQHSRIKTSPNSTTIDEASLEEIDESLASILFNKAFHSNVIKHYYTNNLQQLNMSIVGHWEMEVQEAWYNIRESKSKSCLQGQQGS